MLQIFKSLNNASGVGYLQFLPDGNLISASKYDSQVSLWNLASTPKEKIIFDNLRSFCIAYRENPDTGLLAIADKLDIFLISLSGWIVRRVNSQHLFTSAIAFSADGLKFATGHCDGKVIIWDLHGRILRVIEKPIIDMVNAICFSPDDTKLAIGSEDGTLIVVDANTSVRACTKIYYCNREGRSIKTISFSPSGTKLAVAGEDGLVKLFNVEETHCDKEKNYNSHTRPINTIAFSHDGRFIASGGDDTLVNIFYANQIGLFNVLNFDYPVDAIAFSLDDQQIACGLSNGDILICKEIYDRKTKIVY
jgi:WD40 repeat protein